MRPLQCVLCVAMLWHGPVWAEAFEEDGVRDFHYEQDPDDVWKELELALPAYPQAANLLEIPVESPGQPYRLFVDADSVSVGDDRVVRYTSVLRSPSGAENVSYEGVLCSQRRYKRYAYGSQGRFVPLPPADWQFIRQTRQDAYRALLTDNYFCPLPGRDLQNRILARLRAASRPRSPSSFYDE